jgi:hypothetical protein
VISFARFGIRMKSSAKRFSSTSQAAQIGTKRESFAHACHWWTAPARHLEQRRLAISAFE